MQEAYDWIIEETKMAAFGDQRLNKRYSHLLRSFSSTPTKSIPSSFKSWKETIAAYRFFNNEQVTHHEILAPHIQATLERIKAEKIVLIPQDTTEINFTGRKSMSGMGYLSNEHSQGFYLHPSLAMTPEKISLGVIDMQIHTREKIKTGENRDKKPREAKESHRWIKGYEAANEVALMAPHTIIISMADRAGDIYELLEKLPSEKNKAYWLVQCQYDRAVLNEDPHEEDILHKLKETVRALNPIGEIEFTLPRGKIYHRNAWTRQPRTERNVKQEVRTCTVQLKPPTKQRNRNTIAIQVIHCREIQAPNENEIIEWFLLTSFPVTSAETALEVVQWYLCRFQIELFFKILKSGCTVEELQFETLKATANCVSLYLIVAWRVLYLTMLGRSCPDLPCDAVFEENEWHSVYAIVTKQTPPKEPPKLNEMIFMIAKLGGFLGRKSDDYPGSKAMWIGIQRMRDFALAWESFRAMGNKTYV